MKFPKEEQPGKPWPDMRHLYLALPSPHASSHPIARPSFRKRSAPSSAVRLIPRTNPSSGHCRTQTPISPMSTAVGYACFPSRERALVPAGPQAISIKRETSPVDEVPCALPTPPPSPPSPFAVSDTPMGPIRAAQRQLVRVPPQIRLHLMRGGKVEMRSHDGKMSWIIGLPRRAATVV